MAKKTGHPHANLGKWLHPTKKKTSGRVQKIADDMQKPVRMKGKAGKATVTAPPLSLYPK